MMLESLPRLNGGTSTGAQMIGRVGELQSVGSNARRERKISCRCGSSGR